MSTSNLTGRPDREPGGGAEKRSMTITTPNPRRTSPRDVNRTQDGRKRQKLSHDPHNDSHVEDNHELGDEVPRVLQGEESGSSDQSAGKWFSRVNKNGLTGQEQSAELDGALPAAIVPCKLRRC